MNDSTYRCPEDHDHGPTTTCYRHGCRCAPCTAANTATTSLYRKLIAYGRYDSGLVDAAPARAHMLMLRAAGIGAPRVAELSGVSKSAIRALLYGRSGSRGGYPPTGPSARISRNSATAILAVQPERENLAGGASVDGRGVRRRIQALIARGWSMSRLAAELDVSTQMVDFLARRQTVTVTTHNRIADLFDRLWDKQPTLTNQWEVGGYHRSINRAAARRWLPPLAWDDIDSDSEPPAAEDHGAVDEIALELAISGESVRLTHAEKLEAVRRMHPKKWSNELIAEHLGCEERTVIRLRKELGLPGWPQNDVLDRRAA